MSTPSGLAASNGRRLALLCFAGLALILVCLASIAVGSRNIPLATVLEALFSYADSDDHAIILTLRLPRTLLGLAVGAALGLAGALIQALTRNPLADPGILGVNAGATFAISFGVGFFGIATVQSYIWFAFAGALGATIVVYAVGSVGRGAATPVRLTLSGIAIGAVLTGISSAFAILDPATFDRMRFWSAGSLVTPGLDNLTVPLPFMLGGAILALLVARPLNAIALGDDLAASLGTSMVRIRTVVVVAVTLLAGSATAAAGPITFVGLMIPHVARWIVGPDQRWIFAFTLVLAPILLLCADILGRVIMPPGELQVGIVTAFVGAPVLIVLARRSKASGL